MKNNDNRDDWDWIPSALLLLVMVLFFVYSMYVAITFVTLCRSGMYYP